MAAKRTWSELDERTRKLIIAVAVADGILEVAALIDIKRRSASQIRGPKWLWARGGRGQLRWGRADLILRLRATATAAAIRLTCTQHAR